MVNVYFDNYVTFLTLTVFIARSDIYYYYYLKAWLWHTLSMYIGKPNSWTRHVCKPNSKVEKLSNANAWPIYIYIYIAIIVCCTLNWLNKMIESGHDVHHFQYYLFHFIVLAGNAYLDLIPTRINTQKRKSTVVWVIMSISDNICSDSSISSMVVYVLSCIK